MSFDVDSMIYILKEIYNPDIYERNVECFCFKTSCADIIDGDIQVYHDGQLQTVMLSGMS